VLPQQTEAISDMLPKHLAPSLYFIYVGDVKPLYNRGTRTLTSEPTQSLLCIYVYKSLPQPTGLTHFLPPLEHADQALPAEEETGAARN
jgi:hypothetical protein